MNKSHRGGVSLQGAVKRHGTLTVLHGVDLDIDPGEFFVLLGPSGSGKTTTLRILAGLESISAGRVLLDGQDVTQQDPGERDVAMVFQSYALYPHMTVAQNIGFPLKMVGQGTQAVALAVADAAAKVSIGHLLDRRPGQLSGGQQQRVALARALAPQPRLLLMDEPFSNLDVELREQLAAEVRAVLKATHTTAVFVTHDQNEAFAMADEVAVMSEGRLEQIDCAYNLYHRPTSRFVADFIGQGVFLPGVVVAERCVAIEIGEVRSADPVRHAHDDRECGVGSCIDVLLRPDDVVHDDASPVQAIVRHKAFRGADFLYTLELPSGARVLSMVPSHHNHRIGEPIGIRLEMDHLIAFPRLG